MSHHTESPLAVVARVTSSAYRVRRVRCTRDTATRKKCSRRRKSAVAAKHRCPCISRLRLPGFRRYVPLAHKRKSFLVYRLDCNRSIFFFFFDRIYNYTIVQFYKYTAIKSVFSISIAENHYISLSSL